MMLTTFAWELSRRLDAGVYAGALPRGAMNTNIARDVPARGRARSSAS